MDSGHDIKSLLHDEVPHLTSWGRQTVTKGVDLLVLAEVKLSVHHYLTLHLP